MDPTKPTQATPLDLSTQDLLQLLRKNLAAMPDFERLEFFDELTEGYCKHCGRDDSKSFRGCQCWNDE